MTQHILLTTIGTGRYEESHYAFADGGQSQGTRFFSAALLRHLSPSQPVTQVVVLLTRDAAAHENWQGENGLKKTLSEGNPDVEIIDTQSDPIPDGLSEDDVWAIFNRIAGLIPADCTITLDVTHGFRSLPLIMLLTVAYLRSTKNLTLNGVYYGAFAARKPSAPEEPMQPAPVLDLTPFLTLFEWANAVDAFDRTGDLRQVAYLLKTRQDNLHRSRQENTQDLPKSFKRIANWMGELSDALDLGRLEELTEPLKRLKNDLPKQGEQAARWLPPFTSQIDRIIGLIEPLSPASEAISARLAAQFRLVEWYAGRGYLMHAGLLLREWLITWYSTQLDGKKDWKTLTGDKDQRHEIEKQLGELVELERRLLSGGRLSITLKMGNLSFPIAEVWNALTEMRNDLGHLGHRSDPKPARTISEQLTNLIGQLRPLVQDSTPEQELP